MTKWKENKKGNWQRTENNHEIKKTIKILMISIDKNSRIELRGDNFGKNAICL